MKRQGTNFFSTDGKYGNGQCSYHSFIISSAVCNFFLTCNLADNKYYTKQTRGDQSSPRVIFMSMFLLSDELAACFFIRLRKFRIFASSHSFSSHILFTANIIVIIFPRASSCAMRFAMYMCGFLGTSRDDMWTNRISESAIFTADVSIRCFKANAV